MFYLSFMIHKLYILQAEVEAPSVQRTVQGSTARSSVKVKGQIWRFWAKVGGLSEFKYSFETTESWWSRY